MGGCNTSSCTGSGGTAAEACGRRVCDATQSIQIMTCPAEGEHLTDEVVADCQLLRATADGDLEAMSSALARGAGIETRTSKYVMLPLKTWQEQDRPSASEANSAGLTPLMVAAREGRLEALRLLLASRASPHLPDEDGMRPLHFAAEAASLECCEMLISAGADPSSQDDSGRDAYACVPQEALTGQRERGLWSAPLRPSRAQLAENKECAAANAAAAEANPLPTESRHPAGKVAAAEPATSTNMWDPFLGQRPIVGQDGL